MQLKIFECKRCGACCAGESTVSLSSEEIQSIAQFLNTSQEEFLKKYTVFKGKTRIEMKTLNGYCIFFDFSKKICKIHPVKPLKCKEWPFPPAIFEDEENFKIIQNFCEGLKNFAWEEIKLFKNIVNLKNSSKLKL